MKTKVEEIVKRASEEVLSHLGPGYTEDVYEVALSHELRIRGIPYERQRNFEVIYKGYAVGEARTDITVFPKWAAGDGDEFLLELKAVKKIVEHHKRQAQVYLLSLNIDKGAVVDFCEEGVLMEMLEKPSLKPRKMEVVPSVKKEKGDLLACLKKITSEVVEYFGTSFMFTEAKIEYYKSAIEVELRLRGIEYDRLQRDILYKNFPVSEHQYDIVLPEKTALCICSYKKEDEIEELIEGEGFYFDIFGIKKGIFIGIPSVEGEKAIVKEM